MPERREFIGLSKQDFATVRTEVNDEVFGDDPNEELQPLKDRMTDTFLGGFDSGETVPLEIQDNERKELQNKLDARREQQSEQLERGQSENIFGSVRSQKARTEQARLGLTSDTQTAFDIGEFDVAESDFEQAQQVNQSRSTRSRNQDAAKRARVTNDFEQWQNNPDHFDFPGIDTPTTDPEKQERDVTRGLDDILF